MPISSPFHIPNATIRPFGNMPQIYSKNPKTGTRLNKGVPFVEGFAPDPTEYIFLCDQITAGTRGVDGLTYEKSAIALLQKKITDAVGWESGTYPNGANWQWYDDAEITDSTEGVCGQNLKIPIYEVYTPTDAMPNVNFDYADHFHFYATNDMLINNGSIRKLSSRIVGSDGLGAGYSTDFFSTTTETQPFKASRKEFIGQPRIGRSAKARFMVNRRGQPVELFHQTHLGSIKANRYGVEGMPLISCYTRPDAGSSHFSSADNLQALQSSIVFTSARPNVIISLGYNDCYSDDMMVMQTPQDYETHIESIVSAASQFANVILITPMHHMTRPHSIADANHDDYRSAVYRVASNYKAQVIDLTSYDFSDYFHDDLNLNLAGHEILADILFEELELYKLAIKSKISVNFAIRDGLTLGRSLGEFLAHSYNSGNLEFEGILNASGITANAGDKVTINIGTIRKHGAPCKTLAPLSETAERIALIPIIIGNNWNTSSDPAHAAAGALSYAHLIINGLGSVSVKFNAPQTLTNEVVTLIFSGVRINIIG